MSDKFTTRLNDRAELSITWSPISADPAMRWPAGPSLPDPLTLLRPAQLPFGLDDEPEGGEEG